MTEQFKNSVFDALVQSNRQGGLSGSRAGAKTGSEDQPVSNSSWIVLRDFRSQDI